MSDNNRYNRAKDAFQAALKNYLETTSFGAKSLWIHGKTGKERAEHLLKYSEGVLNMKDLLKLVCMATDHHGRLSTLVLKYITFAGTFDPESIMDKLEYHSDLENETAFTMSIQELLHEELTE